MYARVMGKIKSSRSLEQGRQTPNSCDEDEGVEEDYILNYKITVVKSILVCRNV